MRRVNCSTCGFKECYHSGKDINCYCSNHTFDKKKKAPKKRRNKK